MKKQKQLLPTGINNAYIPPKGWEEITSDEKVERMREIIKQASATVGRQQTEINWLRDIIFKHIHGENGKILVEADRYGSHGSGMGMLGDTSTLSSTKPYF